MGCCSGEVGWGLLGVGCGEFVLGCVMWCGGRCCWCCSISISISGCLYFVFVVLFVVVVDVYGVDGVFCGEIGLVLYDE